ncbi:MAG: hypothetical protein JW982_16865 [Spirochaetes bacterium]|nr:hypothetical protein [Spirochaetota bacterium]
MDYKFLGIDEGRQNLFKGSTASDTLEWKTSLEKYPIARSMQIIGDDLVLAGYDNGYFTIEISTGKIIHSCSRWKEVTSVTRTEEGRILITGTDLENCRGVCVVTLDENDNVIRKVSRKGRYVRLMGVPDKNTYLLSMNRIVLETDSSLRIRCRFRSRKFLHVWKSLRLADDTTVISAGYGACMIRFSKKGKVIQKFGTIDDVPGEVSPFFYGGCELAPDGNILVANWQGHGPSNGGKGRQLLCFSGEGKYITSWSYPEEVSSFQGLLLL